MDHRGWGESRVMRWRHRPPRGGLLALEMIGDSLAGLRSAGRIMPSDRLIRLDEDRIHRLTVFRAAFENLRDGPGYGGEQNARDGGYATRGKASDGLDPGEGISPEDRAA